MSIEERADGVSVYNNDIAIAAFAGVAFGNVDPRFGETDEAEANQRRLASIVGGGRLAVMVVEHGKTIIDLSGTPLEHIKPTYKTDGLITDDPWVVPMVGVADCNAMVMSGKNADGKPAVGLVHIGLQGAIHNIHIVGLEHMQEQHDIPPHKLHFLFPPSIRQSSYAYERLPVEMQTEAWEKYIQVRGNLYWIDVIGKVLGDLAMYGVDTGSQEQVLISDIDTGTDRRFFSYYRKIHSDGSEPELEGRNGVAARLLNPMGA